MQKGLFLAVMLVSVGRVLSSPLATDVSMPVFSLSAYLYQPFMSQGNSFVVSPINAYFSLSALMEGSDEAARKELNALLQLPENRASRVQGMQNLASRLSKVTNPNSIEIGGMEDRETFKFQGQNSIWVSENLNLNPEFEVTAKNFFGFEILRTDFASGRSATEIDKWVRTSANEDVNSPKIQISEDTKMLIANSAYFTGQWLIPFAHEETKERSFVAISGQKVLKKFMKTTGFFRYASEEGTKLIALKYKSGSHSLIIKSGVSHISPGQLSKILSTSETRVRLSVPKFFLDNTLDLQEALKRQGVRGVFQKEGSGLKAASEDPELFVAGVHQACRLAVDEVGTVEAMYAGLPEEGHGYPNDIPLEVGFDEFFSFYIYDEVNKVFLFTGALLK